MYSRGSGQQSLLAHNVLIWRKSCNFSFLLSIDWYLASRLSIQVWRQSKNDDGLSVPGVLPSWITHLRAGPPWRHNIVAVAFGSRKCFRLSLCCLVKLLTIHIPCKTLQGMKHPQYPGKESEQLPQSCLGGWSMEAEHTFPQRGYRWSGKCTIAGIGKEREGCTGQDLLSPHSCNWVQKLTAISRTDHPGGSFVVVMGAGCVWCWRFELHPCEQRQ